MCELEWITHNARSKQLNGIDQIEVFSWAPVAPKASRMQKAYHNRTTLQYQNVCVLNSLARVYEWALASIFDV